MSVYPFSNLYHILYKLVQTFQIKFYTPLCTTLHENKRFTSCAGFFFLFICNSLWENSIGTAVHVSYQLVVSNNVTKYVTCRVSETNPGIFKRHGHTFYNLDRLKRLLYLGYALHLR